MYSPKVKLGFENRISWVSPKATKLKEDTFLSMIKDILEYV